MHLATEVGSNMVWSCYFFQEGVVGVNPETELLQAVNL